MRRLQTKSLFKPPEFIENDNRISKKSDFDFIKKVGDGSYSNVWRVKHKKSEKTFAIKQVQKSKVKPILSQFFREVELLYKISHPHIIKLYSHFEDDRNYYLIMELMEGGTLFHKLYRERSFSESVAAQFLRELVLAIEYLHSFSPPIVHRDLKPENIMLDHEQRVKLIDFGSANYIEPDSLRKTYCGTSEYMSPEMLLKKGHDLGIDIWCLGVLLYEMIVGQPPFKSPDKNSLFKLIIEGNFQFPLKTPVLAKDLICRMLEKDLGLRFNILMVKSSSWLQSVPPIRKTIQNLSVKVPFDCKIEFNTQTTNSSDSGEEMDSDIFKKTSGELGKIRQILIDEKNIGMKIKKKISEISKELSEKYEKITQLEELVFNKNREIKKIYFKGNLLHSNIFDLNLEIERLQINDFQEGLDKKNYQDKNLLELEKKCKVKKNYLETLRKEVNKGSINYVNLEKQLQFLQNALKSLQINALSVFSGNKSSEEGLKLQINNLKSKINESPPVHLELNSYQLGVAQEIIEMIKSQVNSNDGIIKNIENCMDRVEEKTQETEKMIEDLNSLFHVKKSNLMTKFYLNKSKILHVQLFEKFRKIQNPVKQIAELQKKILGFQNQFQIVEQQDISQAELRVKVVFK
jgi:serine/threonine protein kinase